MYYSVGIDRVLDHHLLVYVEYQTLNSPEDGGEVGRGRQLILIPKGETFVYADSLPPNITSIDTMIRFRFVFYPTLI